MRVHNPPTVVGLTALFGAGLLLAGCAGGSDGGGGSAGGSLEDMEPVVLRVALPSPETATPGLAMQAFADYASEASDGKLDFEFHYNATLIPGAELLSGLSSGLADIGLVINSYAPDALPVAAWTDQNAPSMLDWGYPKQTVSLAVQHRLWYGNEVLREEQAAQNIAPLFAIASGPYVLMCAEPFTTPDDLAGRITRVGGEPWATEVTELGMTPSFIPANETYEGLQRGVVDCSHTEPSSIVTQSLLEVGRHVSLVNGSQSSGSQLAINKDTWDSLPLEAQQILFDASVPAMTAFSRGTLNYWQQLVTEGQELGVTFVPPVEINEALEENREAYAEGLAASAPSGLEDPEALVAEFEEIATEFDAVWDEQVGVEPVDPADPEGALEAFQAGSDAIDWEAYEAAMTELIAPVRP
jgi:TRAP-type C4-dicarboxylate transport system substrate-binding protein